MGAPKLSKDAEKQIKGLIKIYKRTADDMDKTMKKAAKNARTPAQEFRARQYKAQAQKSVEALEKAHSKQSPKLVESYYKHGLNVTDYALKEQGVELRPDRGLGDSIHKEGLEVMVEEMTRNGVKAGKSMEERFERFLKHSQQVHVEEQKIQEKVAQGISEGQARKEVSSRIQKVFKRELQEGARIEVIDKNGDKRRYRPDKYSEMLARTQTREAMSEGSQRQCKQYGVEYMQVSVHSGACELCQEFQGRVYTITGDDDRFPKLDERPPFHPNCAHVLVPYVPFSEDDAEFQSLQELSNKPGKIHDHEHYQQALKTGERADEAKEPNFEDRQWKQEQRKRVREGQQEENLLPVTREDEE